LPIAWLEPAICVITGRCLSHW